MGKSHVVHRLTDMACIDIDLPEPGRCGQVRLDVRTGKGHIDCCPRYCFDTVNFFDRLAAGGKGDEFLGEILGPMEGMNGIVKFS